MAEAEAWRIAHCATLIPALQQLYAEDGDIMRAEEGEAAASARL